MSNIKINPYYLNTYLTAGNTKDDFVFENCSPEFLMEAEKLLSKESQDVISCVIKIDQETESQLSNIISQTDDPYIINVIYRDFVTSLVMHQLLTKTQNLAAQSRIDADLVMQGINIMLKGDLDSFKNIAVCLPFQFDIESLVRKIKKPTEINFLLNNTQNKLLQRSINNFISSRNPYVVKVFTTAPQLATYYDQAGHLIEDPHDYMSRDARTFLMNPNADKSM